MWDWYNRQNSFFTFINGVNANAAVKGGKGNNSAALQASFTQHIKLICIRHCRLQAF